MAKNRDIEGIQTNNEKPQIKKGKNYFLGIGINKYQYFTQLENAVNDIQDISDLLTSQFGFEKEHPFHNILLDETATRKSIINKLKNLCRIVKAEDRVLIYYSGHGHMDDITERGYWIPVDAEKEDDSALVSNSDIRDYIKAMNSRHTLLISDSCFSGSLLVRGASRDIYAAFDRWEANKSRWLFCSGKGVVSDGTEGNSPFAKQIIRHLSDPTVDRININHLADNVIKSVSFNHKQQAEAAPFFGTNHDGGQYIFYKKEVDTKAIENAAFEKALKSKNRQELLQFLNTSSNKEHKNKILEILESAENKEAWEKINKKSIISLHRFVNNHPLHEKIAEAKSLLNNLQSNPESSQLIDEKKEQKDPLPKVEKPKINPTTDSRTLLKNNLKNLIANNKIEKVFKEIKQFLSAQADADDLQNELILLQGRFNSLLRDSRLGLLRPNEESVERNRIVSALLSMIDDL